jgi:hypothetical protein
MRRGVALCSLPILAVAIAWTASMARGDGSGIKGRVVPCGIVLERPAPCAVAPKSVGTVVVGRRDHVVRRTKVRADGSFRVPLDAGRYWLQARADSTPSPRTHATVSDGKWNTVSLVAGRVAPPRER